MLVFIMECELGLKIWEVFSLQNVHLEDVH
jgi:hypothetical protein